MPEIREGGRVTRRTDPTLAGTVVKILKKSADVMWDDEDKIARVAVAKIEARGRGRIVGTVAPVPVEPSSVVFSCKIAAKIRARLATLNMSLSQLAARSGVSKSTICRVIQGEGEQQTVITVHTLEALATALGISPKEFWGDGKPTPRR